MEARAKVAFITSFAVASWRRRVMGRCLLSMALTSPRHHRTPFLHGLVLKQTPGQSKKSPRPPLVARHSGRLRPSAGVVFEPATQQRQAFKILG